MSGSVDDEVVRMRFDNNAFERAVAATLGTLSKLKSSLNFTGADKGLDGIEAKANKFSLQGMSNGVDGISKKFSALSVVGVTALATIANKAVTAGLNIAKSFTTGPIKAGFENYETQINAVQTILANTGLKGAPGLAAVNKTLAELNTYANKTVYNFSEMTKNIGTFTAAGVALQPATDAIKGIANLAALSGSSSDQASTAMYQLSQAIAANKVGLQDWNSVVNAGLGGKVFQKALFNTGKLQGTLKGVKANETFDQWTKAGNSFRNSLQSGWITGKVLTSTLSQFTGDLTDAQLKSQGYNAEQIKEIQELAKTASGAATNIKTFTQLTSALKEEVATAYGAIFKTIFGDINGATKLFSGIHTVVENALTVPIYALNTLLQKTSELGGRAKAIKAFTTVFHAMGGVFDAVKDAYRSIFPATTPKGLLDTINAFGHFANLLQGFVTANKGSIENTFKGIFAVFDIGKQVVLGVVHVFTQLFSSVAGTGSNGFLEFTGRVGLMIVAFDKALKSGGLLTNFFQIVGNVLAIPIHLFQIAGAVISQLFAGFKPKSADGVTDSVTRAGDALGRLADITDNVDAWFSGLAGKIRPGVQAVINAFGNIGHAIASGFDSKTFGSILKTINTGLLAGIVLLLKKFLKGGINVDVGGGIFGKVSEALEGVTGNLKAMQTELKAKALLEIAAALGILVLSVVALAAINPQKLQGALKAMAIGFGELLGAMAILTKITGSAGFVKIPLMAASLDLLAGAILILTVAVAILSRMSWQELEKGLTAIGILLAALSASSVVLSANSAGMVRSGIGITAMAVALNLLAIAVKVFATMSWSQMLKGLAGVGIALAGIALAMRIMPKGMLLQAAAILVISVALNALYLAVKEFATLSYGTMIKGLIGIAGALVGIAIGMQLMPKGMLLQSVALIAVSVALQLIAKAVESMAQMSWSQIAKGLTALAGAMIILAGALLLMDGSLVGAAALLIVSEALHIFVPALMALGSMSWGKILKGLAALAAAFALIGIAGLLLEPVIPGMLGLGLALGLVGVAMLAFGVGASLLGIGLTAIAASGGAAIAVLITGLKGLIDLLPVLAKNLATALVSFITIIGKNAPAIIGAFVSLLTSLLEAVPKIMPSLIAAIASIVQGILTVLLENTPKLIAAGLQLLMDLLNGIKNNIGRVTTTVVDIIVNFLNALASNMPRIIAAGVNLLFKFLEGVAKAAGQIPAEVIKLIAIFLGALFGSLPKIVSAGTTLVNKMITGIGKAFGMMTTAGVQLVGKLIKAIIGQTTNLLKAGYQLISDLAGRIGDAIFSIGQYLWDKAKEIGGEIVDGILEGLKDLAKKVKDVIQGALGGTLDDIEDFLGAGSPSMVFANRIGKPISEGVAYGIDQNAGLVTDSVRSMGKTSILEMKKTMSGLAEAISADDVNYNPTITPVLDLSQVKKDAGSIGGLLTANPINAAVSFGQASDILASRAAAENDALQNQDVNTQPVPTSIKIEQNNTSPKALSTIDIYRQTNNALSLAKKALGVSP
jgi:tape measure domain-containing protein